jgi:hypothetical protein
VLNVPVAEIGLQGARIVALVSQRVAAGVPQHMRVRLENASLASVPTRSTVRAKPAVLKGAPRSEVNTKG